MIEESTISPRKMKGVDFSAAGPENDDYAKAWRDAMDWTRIEIDYVTLKQYFLIWAKLNRDLDEQGHWDALPTYHYAMIGRIAFVVQHGAVMPENTKTWFDAKVEELLQVKVALVDDEEQRKLTTIQKRNVEYVDLYSMLEAISYRYRNNVDEITERAKKFLARSEPNQQMLKRLYDHFKESFSDAIKEKDNPFVAERVESIITVVNILATSTGNAKAIRDNRGATTKSIKQASKAKFKAVDLDTDMAGMNPAMIPGSKVAIVYNAKTRKVSFYSSSTDAGLGISGNKLTGFATEQVYAKHLRDPKMVLRQLRNATNLRRIDVVMEDVNGKKHPVSGKLNKDTLIIKVFK